MQRHNTYSSNNSSSASGSEHSSDIGADHARFELQKNSVSSKKIGISMLSSKVPDIPSIAPAMSSLEPPPEINDPSLFRPSFGHVNDIVWQHCTLRGWVTKHIPPSYSFTKSRKVRYAILADRILYTFKNDKQTTQYREFFELTKDTDVFVTDHFQGVLFCIEIIKRGVDPKSWFLECSGPEDMKIWLQRLKKTVGWLKENDGKEGIITNSKLGQVYLNEHEAIVANALARAPAPVQVTPAPSTSQVNRSTSLSSSDGFSSGQESCYSSSTGMMSPKTPPLLADPSYYQNIMMVASANHYQQQQQQQQQHYYQPHPHHQDCIPSSLPQPPQVLPPLPGNLYYTNAYVEEWEPTQKQLQQQYTHSPRATLSAPHVLPPQRPPPRRALPPPPTPAAIQHYQQRLQRMPPRSAYLQ